MEDVKMEDMADVLLLQRLVDALSSWRMPRWRM